MIIDIKPAQKWNRLPKEIQQQILNHVFRGKCFVTTIVDYDITDHPFGVLVKGKCKKCGEEVARLVEDA